MISSRFIGARIPSSTRPTVSISRVKFKRLVYLGKGPPTNKLTQGVRLAILEVKADPNDNEVALLDTWVTNIFKESEKSVCLYSPSYDQVLWLTRCSALSYGANLISLSTTSPSPTGLDRHPAGYKSHNGLPLWFHLPKSSLLERSAWITQ